MSGSETIQRIRQHETQTNQRAKIVVTPADTVKGDVLYYSHLDIVGLPSKPISMELLRTTVLQALS